MLLELIITQYKYNNVFFSCEVKQEGREELLLLFRHPLLLLLLTTVIIFLGTITVLFIDGVQRTDAYANKDFPAFPHILEC